MMASNAAQRNRQHLSRREECAVDLVLRGMRTAEIAAELGVQRSTVWRWQQKPSFQRALQERRKRSTTEATEVVSGLALEASHGGDHAR